MTVPAGDNLRIEIVNFLMYKIHPSGLKDELDLRPQLMEFIFYQSVFDPLITAEILLNDGVSFQNNYPLTGEEFIVVELKQEYPNGFFDAGITKENYQDTYKLYFVIQDISDIYIRDDSKSSFLKMNLVSVESFANEMQHISLVNKDDKNLEKFANKIFEEYIAKPLQKTIKGKVPYSDKIAMHARFKDKSSFFDMDFDQDLTTEYIKYEESIGERPNMIIPNMRPLQAINFLTKHTVGKGARAGAQNLGNYTYTFFENLRGFYFVTLEKLASQGRFGNKGSSSAVKYRNYYYLPDRAIINQIAGAKDDDFFASRMINNLFINKKYSSQDKTVGGYYQNRLIEINMAQWSYNPPHDNTISASDKRLLADKVFNTTGYISERQNENIGTTNNVARVRYTINNFKNDPIPEIRKKWGKTTINSHALNQIDVSISIPTDINIMPGDVIILNIPEMSSFTDGGKWDPFMTGHYLVVETKQVVLADGTATTSLRLYKDGVGGDAVVEKDSSLGKR